MSAPPETLRYALVLSYDGGPFHGWQVQPDRSSVQGEIEGVLERITGGRRPVLGSGRTDRGVHATGQVAAVTVPGGWSAPRLRRALNALLPPEIRVDEVRRVPEDFHPRYDAVARTYRYRLGIDPGAHSPFRARWCWNVSNDPPDPARLAEAAALIPGERDFGRFARSGQPERGTRCHVRASGWMAPAEGNLEFEITADRYLHHMVRYLVGTMVAVARGHRPIRELEELLENPATPLVTSPPAPPEGLFLTRVDYPPERTGNDPDRDPLPGGDAPS